MFKTGSFALADDPVFFTLFYSSQYFTFHLFSKRSDLLQAMPIKQYEQSYISIILMIVCLVVLGIQLLRRDAEINKKNMKNIKCS